MKKTLPIILIIVLAVVGYFLWSRSSQTSTNCSPTDVNCYKDISSWKTFTDNANGISFQYPEKLPTTFVFTQKWPPVITIKPELFSCDNVQKINGRNYCLQTKVEGAAGSIYTSYQYSTDTANGDETIVVDFTLRASQCGNYNAPEKEACENQQKNFDLGRLVDRMITTLARREKVS